MIHNTKNSLKNIFFIFALQIIILNYILLKINCLYHLFFTEEGVTKTFTCARTLIGQHVFLQLVGVEGSLSLCEIEIFTTDGKATTDMSSRCKTVDYI